MCDSKTNEYKMYQIAELRQKEMLLRIVLTACIAVGAIASLLSGSDFGMRSESIATCVLSFLGILIAGCALVPASWKRARLAREVFPELRETKKEPAN